MRHGGLIRAASRLRSKKKRKRKKNMKKSAPPKTQHEIHSSPATATTSRRRATKYVPRVSPYSPAFIDPGFVEIDLVQLSKLLWYPLSPVAALYFVVHVPSPYLAGASNKASNYISPSTRLTPCVSDLSRARSTPA